MREIQVQEVRMREMQVREVQRRTACPTDLDRFECRCSIVPSPEVAQSLCDVPYAARRPAVKRRRQISITTTSMSRNAA